MALHTVIAPVLKNRNFPLKVFFVKGNKSTGNWSYTENAFVSKICENAHKETAFCHFKSQSSKTRQVQKMWLFIVLLEIFFQKLNVHYSVLTSSHTTYIEDPKDVHMSFETSNDCLKWVQFTLCIHWHNDISELQTSFLTGIP